MEPLVTVIIPVGPRHAAALPDALHSLMAQQVAAWEALVINDTGAPLDLPTMPRVRVVDGPEHPEGSPGTSRAARCRNLGLARARAPWVVFLDADDALTSGALAAMLAGAVANPETCYVYGSWWNLRPDGRTDLGRGQYDQRTLLTGNIHPITALVPAEVARRVGGFDPAWEVYEDYEFWLRLAAAGCCGVAIDAATLIYRSATGGNRDGSWSRKSEVASMLMARYGAYLRGETAMAGCCGGGNARALNMAKKALGDLGHGPGEALGGAGLDPDTLPGGRVRMEAKGAAPGYYRNPFAGGSGEQYRVSPGNGRFISAHPADVEWLQGRGFAIVRRPQYEQAAPIAPTLPDAPAPIAAADEGDEDADTAGEGAAESVAPRRRGRSAPKDGTA